MTRIGGGSRPCPRTSAWSIRPSHRIGIDRWAEARAGIRPTSHLTFWRTDMYAITGITGQVGGALARALLAANQPVRAVLRDAAKAPAWTARGCEIAVAEIEDATALTMAFTAADDVFILLPPQFD